MHYRKAGEIFAQHIVENLGGPIAHPMRETVSE